ncbi:MAG: V-type ATP synthase subunit D [Kribbellaceae bacterium]
MAGVRGVPPGRAGRLWLQRRLVVARRSAALLDQKLRILLHEQERFALLVGRTGPEWSQRCREAEIWLLRSCLIGGQRALRHATDGERAEVTVGWAGAMGLRYPSEASYRAPAPDTGGDSGTGATTGAAVQQTSAAHRLALDAAVRHAAAQAALRAIEAEMAATRRRLRAVEDRWIPRLESTLAAVLLELAEAERSEGVRLRWAADTVDEPAGGERR